MEDLSPDGDLGWLGAGLAEDLTHDLANVRSLDVRSRTAVRSAHRRGLSLEEIGEEFNLTRERIRQLEKLALCRLRHPSFGIREQDLI